MMHRVVRFKKVEINVKNWRWTGDRESTKDATLRDVTLSRPDVYTKFNKELFEAFTEKRKYAIIGVALLALSLILQNVPA